MYLVMLYVKFLLAYSARGFPPVCHPLADISIFPLFSTISFLPTCVLERKRCKISLFYL